MGSLQQILETLAEALTTTGWLAPLLAFIAGMVTSFLPCTLSTVALVIGYVGGGKADSRQGFRLSALFALGMTITMAILGVAAALLGNVLMLGGSWFFILLGVLMVLMALQLFGVFEFIPSTYMTSHTKRRGSLGALIAGILAGLFASPCSTPVLVVLLGIVATQGSVAWGTLLFLLYALGHSILIIAIGTSVGLARQIATSPRYGAISQLLQIGLGIIVLALGLYMFYLGF
ncbi:MAG: sulfite exporter TauE/SafE family protein [Coriobacteriia bacterium]|nr:sulfite exporter TauE/SafE family protein [Coriobacteriia bacterium]